MSQPPLRGYPGPVAGRRDPRARCPRGGSCRDPADGAESFRDPDDDPAERRHHDPRVGHRRAAALRDRRRGLDPRPPVAAEVHAHLVSSRRFGATGAVSHALARWRPAWGSGPPPAPWLVVVARPEAADSGFRRDAPGPAPAEGA